MKFVTVLAASTLAFASVALADDHATFAKVDADADGQVTLEEGMKVHADWTEEAFKELDKDGSGALSQEEYEASMAAENK